MATATAATDSLVAVEPAVAESAVVESAVAEPERHTESESRDTDSPNRVTLADRDSVARKGWVSTG